MKRKNRQRWLRREIRLEMLTPHQAFIILHNSRDTTDEDVRRTKERSLRDLDPKPEVTAFHGGVGGDWLWGREFLVVQLPRHSFGRTKP